MIIYVLITFVSVILLIAIFFAAPFVAPEFLGSEDFYESLIVEGISFVVTTAIIGSLSALILRYNDERKARPIREMSQLAIANAFADFARDMAKLLSKGIDTEIDYTRRYMIGGGALKVYRAYKEDEVRELIAAARTSARFCKTQMDRYSQYFSIEDQDNFHQLSDALNEVTCDLEIADSFLLNSEYTSQVLAKWRDHNRDQIKRWSLDNWFEEARTWALLPEIAALTTPLFMKGDNGEAVERFRKEIAKFGEPYSTAYLYSLLKCIQLTLSKNFLDAKLPIEERSKTNNHPFYLQLVLTSGLYSVSPHHMHASDESAGLFARLPCGIEGDGHHSINMPSMACDLWHIVEQMNPWVDELTKTHFRNLANDEFMQERIKDQRTWDQEYVLPRFTYVTELKALLEEHKGVFDSNFPDLETVRFTPVLGSGAFGEKVAKILPDWDFDPASKPK